MRMTAFGKLKFYGCCPHNPFPTNVFQLVIRRHWVMHFMYILVPILLIRVMAIVQFLLPCDSGENVVLGITIYLSMLVHLLMVSEVLPLTEKLPVITQFIIDTVIMLIIMQVRYLLYVLICLDAPSGMRT